MLSRRQSNVCVRTLCSWCTNLTPLEWVSYWEHGCSTLKTGPFSKCFAQMQGFSQRENLGAASLMLEVRLYVKVQDFCIWTRGKVFKNTPVWTKFVLSILIPALRACLLLAHSESSLGIILNTFYKKTHCSNKTQTKCTCSVAFSASPMHLVVPLSN